MLIENEHKAILHLFGGVITIKLNHPFVIPTQIV